MSSNKYTFNQSLTIDQNHPSLAGHFPGNPIVPGVVILDQVIRLWQKETQKKVRCVLNTKFVNVLKAEIDCTIQYQKKNNQKIDFVIIDGKQQVIAKGLFAYAD